MEWLSLTDVEQIVHLVSEAADPTVEIPLPERKRLLLEGVAQLVDADCWLWSSSVFNPNLRSDDVATALIDGGWTSGQQRAKFLEALYDPRVRPMQARIQDAYRNTHITFDRDSLTQDEWQALDTLLASAGIGHFLVSFYPLGEYASSGFGFYRRQDRAAFTGRDRAVVHVVCSQVDWLHRHGMDVPAKNKVVGLSRREREVMAFLLSGDSQKEVAHKLRLSEHTVGDYVKQIYKHFGVTSRAELLAHFISGGRN
jgi:DNA-binding CsgD family transcriptional regulator